MFEIFKIGRLKEHKKGSLELSINAIIIVVLAMTLLGLGLGFIRGMFKKITGTTETVQEQVKEQILEDLRTGDKKLSFPSVNVNLERGSTTTIAFGVKNTKGVGNINFIMDIRVTGAKGAAEVTESAIYADNPTVDAPITFFYNEGPFKLGAADSEVYAVQLTDDKNAVDVYKVRMRVITYDVAEDGTPIANSETTYAEKTFFLNVGWFKWKRRWLVNKNLKSWN